MYTRSSRAICVVGATIVTFVVVGAAVARAGDAGTYQRMLAEKSKSLVTVKFILKVKMGGRMAGMGEQESETELTALMIDPAGIAICSNTELGGFVGVMKQMMGPMGGEMSATPQDVKVLVGDDEEGLDAEIIARDSDLDLAWVRIKDAGDRKFDAENLGGGSEPQVGQAIVLLSRVGKYFGRAPSIIESRIGGVTTRPRKLFLTANPITSIGAPVYAESGSLIGLAVLQMPEADDTDFDPMMMMTRASSMQEMMAPVILPASAVNRATKRALETVQGD